ncbi:MAG TPA: hypothetical protein VK021_06215 [Flavobacteriaceae bacterium]|nr:hypothetical protein [Flavobacteriaceae bacterium]
MKLIKKTKIDEITSNCSFKVLEVNNKWIKIKPFERSKYRLECKTKEGWIKWRDNNEVLILVILGVAY